MDRWTHIRREKEVHKKIPATGDMNKFKDIYIIVVNQVKLAPFSSMNQQSDDLPRYKHIHHNVFPHRKQKKQRKDDIAICVCKYDPSDLNSACGKQCLNVLTSTECTSGYCPCGTNCRNQRFQKCEYAKLKLIKTENRGWGVLADENIKTGQFVMEYCGEVLTRKEVCQRFQAYEDQGIEDAYTIWLNASECIDATMKGNHARFINHSCQPNCEARKWNVSGEIRVGIFAKQDIPVGTELGYDYNFQRNGGPKVRCLCGAANCRGFLGAKSRHFQGDAYNWDNDDERYPVDNIPVYDSSEDDPSAKYSMSPKRSVISDSKCQLKSTLRVVQPLESTAMEGVVFNAIKNEESEGERIYTLDTQQASSRKNVMVSCSRHKRVRQKDRIGSASMPKSSQFNSDRELLPQKQVDAKHVTQLLASKEAQEEILRNEEKKNKAASRLDSVYDEVRLVLEKNAGDDGQERTATSLDEKWIEASCLAMKSEVELYSSIITSLAGTLKSTSDQSKPCEEEAGNGKK